MLKRILLSAIALSLVLLTAYSGWCRIVQDEYMRATVFYEKEQNWKAMLVMSDNACFANKYNPVPYGSLGRALLMNGRISSAIASLEKSREQQPYYMNTLINLGISYLAIGDEKKANTMKETIERIDPNFTKYVTLGGIRK